MHPAAPGGRAPGQNAGWLGKAFDPFQIEGDPSDSSFQVEGLGLPAGISPARLADRRVLLSHLTDVAQGSGGSVRSWDGHQRRALDALVSAEGAGPFSSSGKIPGYATATGGRSTVRASCWRAG